MRKKRALPRPPRVYVFPPGVDADIGRRRVAEIAAGVALTPEDRRKDFGLWIRNARKAKGLTQGQAAESAGISVAHWSRIETGITGSSKNTVLRAANALLLDSNEALYRAGLAYSTVTTRVNVPDEVLVEWMVAPRDPKTSLEQSPDESLAAKEYGDNQLAELLNKIHLQIGEAVRLGKAQGIPAQQLLRQVLADIQAQSDQGID